MNKMLLGLFFALSLNAAAQDCDYNITKTEDGQELKSTKEAMMYEKVFAGTSQFIFFSLRTAEGIPVLDFQLLAKSKDFPKIYCLDKASKIYIQLSNGKIVTLISALDEQCSGLIYDSNEQNNIRILTGSFLFTLGSLEDLEKYPISFIRVKYQNELVDYPIKKELQSETTGVKYSPERYFMNSLKCIQ